MSTPAPQPASDQEIAALAEQGLYDPEGEHDACGVGFVAHIKGVKGHAIVQHASKAEECDQADPCRAGRDHDVGTVTTDNRLPSGSLNHATRAPSMARR